MDERLAAHLAAAGGSDDDYVERAFRLVLRRDPDPEARTRAVEALGNGTLSRATLLHELVTSDESARVRTLDDALAFARWARRAGERPRGLAAPSGDERPVEIAWVLSRYRDEPRVLDCGYAFAEPAYLAALAALGAPGLVGVDLAEADVPGLRAVRADLRALPFGRGSFDVDFLVFEHEVYALGPEGWRPADALDPGGVRFAGTHAAAVLCAELHPATLRRRGRETARRLRRR